MNEAFSFLHNYMGLIDSSIFCLLDSFLRTVFRDLAVFCLLDSFLRTKLRESAVFCPLDSFLWTVEQDLLSFSPRDSFLWTVERDLLSTVREILMDLGTRSFLLTSRDSSLQAMKYGFHLSRAKGLHTL